MFWKIRKHLSYANMVATLALVFATTGGAYAVNNAGDSSRGSARAHLSKKKSKPKAGSRGSVGPRGPAGPAGPPGLTGPAGTSGSNGTSGTNGASVTSSAASAEECPTGGVKLTSASGTTAICNGASGKNGKQGENVVTAELAPGANAHCPEGGSEFSVGGNPPTYACTGKEGKEGNIKGTLAPGQMETGVWSFQTTAEAIKDHFCNCERVPISFPIPLKQALTGVGEVHFINEGGEEVTPTGTQTSTACRGTFEEPTAEAGNLCIYTNEGEGGEITSQIMGNPETRGGATEAGTTGGFLIFNITENHVENYGDWAVTEKG